MQVYDGYSKNLGRYAFINCFLYYRDRIQDLLVPNLQAWFQYSAGDASFFRPHQRERISLVCTAYFAQTISTVGTRVLVCVLAQGLSRVEDVPGHDPVAICNVQETTPPCQEPIK